MEETANAICNYQYSIFGICLSILYVASVFSPFSSIPRISFTRQICKYPNIRLKNGSIIINNIHMHHWAIFTLICILLWLFNKYNYTFFGFSLIMILHGLSYKDRFMFIENDD